ncbi:MAG: ParB/RepB/Spo0J family partition protein [Methanobrevibacter boviskoreani]|uniref:ParB/RepB/Spo0J family partition protein n=1 Tax=Methanobrevibacter boviskoreani TaxID=1348249 RepID=UPI0023A8A49F|nr:ParB/RepB/Spo0J family partition protein [Methanobrevibacter boviskoreani]MCI6930886.1 ParB/RepB/Spo0J family partition protein [Methanobrevibacter boviskoreani]
METIANNNIMNNEINATKRTDIYQIDPRNIVVVEGFNARKNFDLDELKEQIRKVGVLNPITVIPFKDKETGAEKYRLVDGERRYRAVMALLAEGEDIKRIKAMYLPKGTKEEDLLIQQLLKNTGKQFSEIEMAKLFNRFKEQWGYTQTEIADKFCKKASFVSRCMALLELPAEIIEMMERGEISADTARQIVSQNKDDEDAQVEAADKAVKTAKAKGKKTATTKDIPVNVRAANLIAKIRKDLKKYATLMDSLDGENAEVMMTNAINVYEQTAEWENAAKDLTPKAVSEPQTAEEVDEVEKVA